MSDQEKKVFAQEVSKDDLKAVTGGYTDFDPRTDSLKKQKQEAKKDADRTHCVEIWQRNIYEGGFPNCAATVGDGSQCRTNDACYDDAVKYTGMDECHFINCHKSWH